eukprot:CAMPEP_0117450774 /NCGR_PEP_ID=MMETSP0759-20121206/8648_1 /TAXON_ID=63605 /ORGANISM="Percolomonas cosmopolitus, Strain WS" /LENGTH=526 /DNA_ID=CAMNT_0005243319 /DNA_START=59 /DNA_END=1636 /DNA_ORIENTATION=-
MSQEALVYFDLPSSNLNNTPSNLLQSTLEFSSSIFSKSSSSAASQSSDSQWSPCTYRLTSHYLFINTCRFPYDAIESINTAGAIRQYIRIEICRHEWWDEVDAAQNARAARSRNRGLPLKKFHVEPQIIYLKGLKMMRQRNFVALVRYLNSIGVPGGIVGDTGRHARRKRGASMPLELDILLEETSSGQNQQADSKKHTATTVNPQNTPTVQAEKNNEDLSDIVADAHQIQERNREILQSLHRQQHLIHHSQQDMEYMKYLLSISDKLLRSINSVRGTIWNIFSGTLSDPDETTQSNSVSSSLREKLHFLLEKQVPIIYAKHSERPFDEQIYALAMMIFFTDAIRIVDDNQNILMMISYDTIWKYDENDIQAVVHFDKSHDKELVFYSRFNEKIGERLKRLCNNDMRYHVQPGALAERKRRERIQRALKHTLLQEELSNHITLSNAEPDNDSASEQKQLVAALREKEKQKSLTELSSVLRDVKDMQMIAGEFLDESSNDLDRLTHIVEKESKHVNKANEVIHKKTE